MPLSDLTKHGLSVKEWKHLTDYERMRLIQRRTKPAEADALDEDENERQTD